MALQSRKTALDESKTMTAAATSTAGQMPLTVENMQDAVEKALVTRGPRAAAFAGMHEIERGDGFGLEKNTAFGAIAEGATADKASTGGVDTGEARDIKPRRLPNLTATILEILTWISVTIGILLHNHNGDGTLGCNCGRYES